MVAMKSKAAEVMWKMMMKARSTSIFTGRGGPGSRHVKSPETGGGGCAKGGKREKFERCQ